MQAPGVPIMPCADSWGKGTAECGSSQPGGERAACENLGLWKQYAADVNDTIVRSGYGGWCRQNYLPDYEPEHRRYFSQSLITADCSTGLMNIMCLKNGTAPLSGDSNEASILSRIVQSVTPPVTTALLPCAHAARSA